jgi:hypothetical protein
MSSLLKYVISSLIVFLLAGTAVDATPPGFLEGHLKVFSSREVELADDTPSKMTAENYVDYPLVILSRENKTEAAHVTADEHGNYRIALPPGDYILDVQRRMPKGRMRAKPQSFKVVSNQTVRVDMDVDTGVR